MAVSKNNKTAQKTKNPFFTIGQAVQWKWMGRYIDGSVLEIYHDPITINIKGKNIKRNGSAQKPAYLVESVAGNKALKLQSELLLPQKTNTKRRTPTMFS